MKKCFRVLRGLKPAKVKERPPVGAAEATPSPIAAKTIN